MLEHLQILAQNNIIVWLIITFIGMIIANIFPIMFFLYPDIFIFLWIFLATKFVPVRVPYILLIIWAFIGETISYFIGYKYWDKILTHKFIQNNEKIIKFVEKLKNNQVKTLVIGKLIPWIVRVIPVISWAIKMDLKKFLIINFFMIVYGITYLFIVWLVWFKLALHFLGEKAWYLLIVIVIWYLIFEYIRRKRK